jgi:hypothetical protein
MDRTAIRLPALQASFRNTGAAEMPIDVELDGEATAIAADRRAQLFDRAVGCASVPE